MHCVSSFWVEPLFLLQKMLLIIYGHLFWRGSPRIVACFDDILPFHLQCAEQLPTRYPCMACSPPISVALINLEDEDFVWRIVENIHDNLQAGGGRGPFLLNPEPWNPGCITNYHTKNHRDEFIGAAALIGIKFFGLILTAVLFAFTAKLLIFASFAFLQATKLRVNQKWSPLATLCGVARDENS
ncbi:hypothetical protein CDL12_15166 [Handroanthus impetiginosus]|uniref:Uncharacterized protein n=1 Tax=Handroanthus impetiginosus TaxID=429701 RepID=A0A2G9H3X2_9LAMI|nr:hypothetical protein CDL12_15166 [Handroanthus impetiginosus]